MNWTPRTWAGVGILAAITVALIWWLSIDPRRAEAWALLTQVISVAGRMVEAG